MGTASAQFTVMLISLLFGMNEQNTFLNFNCCCGTETLPMFASVFNVVVL